jgi:hypothetical protein
VKKSIEAIRKTRIDVDEWGYVSRMVTRFQGDGDAIENDSILINMQRSMGGQAEIPTRHIPALIEALQQLLEAK